MDAAWIRRPHGASGLALSGTPVSIDHNPDRLLPFTVCIGERSISAAATLNAAKREGERLYNELVDAGAL